MNETIVGRKRKTSMFEYCKEEDKEYAILQIEWWNEHTKKYYDVIVKLYGPTYDKLDETVLLTEEEQSIWKSIVQDFEKLVEVQKTKLSLNLENGKNNSNSHGTEKESELNCQTKEDTPIDVQKPVTKKADAEYSQELEKQNLEIVSAYQNRKEKILIKDIFPYEIIEIQFYILQQMQSLDSEKQEDAQFVWTRLNELLDCPTNDNLALNKMTKIVELLHNYTISPIDKESIPNKSKYKCKVR